MDPKRAKEFEQQQWDKFHKNRIKKEIDQAYENFQARMKNQPELEQQHADWLRRTITEIAGIAQYDDFREIFENAKTQLNTLEDLEKWLKKSGYENVSDAPAMDELSSDEPDEEIISEQATTEEVDARLEDTEPSELGKPDAPAMDELSSDEPDEEIAEPVGETPVETSVEMTLEDAQKAYFDKNDKDVPSRFKNDIEWIKSKL